MKLKDWANEIIKQSVPFKARGRGRDGIDCWGLVWLAYREVYGVEIPSYTEVYKPDDVKDLRRVGQLIDERRHTWRQVPKPREGDVVLMELHGRPVHVGLIVAHRKMLHIERDINVCLEDYTRIVWAGRVKGFYRHQSNSGDAPV